MQERFAGMPPDVVEKAREVERVVPVEGCIQVGRARAIGVSLVFFLCLLFVLTAEFASLMYEKEKQDCNKEGRTT